MCPYRSPGRHFWRHAALEQESRLITHNTHSGDLVGIADWNAWIVQDMALENG